MSVCNCIFVLLLPWQNKVRRLYDVIFQLSFSPFSYLLVLDDTDSILHGQRALIPGGGNKNTLQEYFWPLKLEK